MISSVHEHRAIASERVVMMARLAMMESVSPAPGRW
jgi:hypothetical protein